MKKLMLTSVISIFSISAFAQPLLTTKVPFGGSMVRVNVDLASDSFSVGNLFFKNANVSLEKNNIVYTGKKGDSISAVLYVQDAGNSKDFECPGVDLPQITNGRVIISSIDSTGKKSLLTDNCIFLEAPKQ